MVVRKKQGLGRGLDTLLGEDPLVALPSGNGDAVVELDLSKLKPGRYQPRSKWENDKLEEYMVEHPARPRASPAFRR